MAFARIKPQNINRIDDGLSSCFSIDESAITIHSASQNGDVTTSRYRFVKVFKPSTSQHTVFEEAALPGIQSLLDGENALIFSYGSSSSGKTFTMQGTATEPGILPRALLTIFASVRDRLDIHACLQPVTLCQPTFFTNEEKLTMDLEKRRILEKIATSYPRCSLSDALPLEMSEVFNQVPALSTSISPNSVCSVWVSFCELYNELIIDLLADSGSQQSLHLSHDKEDGSYYPAKLRHFLVHSWEEAYGLYRFGRKRAHVAETVLNRKSSRSHCVFTVKLLVRATDVTNDYESLASYHVCDLAGNERIGHAVARGDATSTDSQAINKSLLALNKCFLSLKENKNVRAHLAVPPFRDSKLTMLFKKFLSGKDHLSILANVSQDVLLMSQTHHVLQMMSIAHELTVQPLTLRQGICTKTRARRFSTMYGDAHATPCSRPDKADSEREEIDSVRLQLQKERERTNELEKCLQGEQVRSYELIRSLNDQRALVEKAQRSMSSTTKFRNQTEAFQDQHIRDLEAMLLNRTTELGNLHTVHHDLIPKAELKLDRAIRQLKTELDIDMIEPSAIVARVLFLFRDMKQAASEELKESTAYVASLEAVKADQERVAFQVAEEMAALQARLRELEEMQEATNELGRLRGIQLTARDSDSSTSVSDETSSARKSIAKRCVRKKTPQTAPVREPREKRCRGVGPKRKLLPKDHLDNCIDLRDEPQQPLSRSCIASSSIAAKKLRSGREISIKEENHDSSN